MTTQELAKQLEGMFVRFATETEDEAASRRIATARAAASRLSEMEAENARLRELRRVSFMQMLAVLRQCSDRLEIFNSSFSDIDPLSDTIVQYRSDANDSFVLERRAALEHQP